MNIHEALDRLGADEMAPEGSQAWTLAEIGRQHEQTVEALCVAREALIAARTLRDYFAAQELAKKDDTAVCDRPEVYARLAKHCYRMADAMLAARKGEDA